MNKNLLAIEKNKMSPSVKDSQTPGESKREKIVSRNTLREARGQPSRCRVLKSESTAINYHPENTTFSSRGQMWEDLCLVQRWISRP